MPKIAHEEISAAYSVGKAVFAEEITESQGVATLVQTRGMSDSSASDYIRNLRQMLKGEAFQRTLNLAGTDFYLHNIKSDFGEPAYRNALQSLERHLDYYEKLETGHPQPGQRKLLAQHRRLLGAADFEIIAATLETAVRASSMLSSDERKKRLLKASKTPATAVATVVVYVRNPDVIAEVRARANGICESCGRDAPFLKRSDGSPYLEVHHKIRLADGGEDTVENANAICPNCHRRAHFG